MITIFNPQYHINSLNNENGFNGYRWIVNWEDFEGEFKTIENVSAELTGIKDKCLKDYIDKILPQSAYSIIKTEENFQYGTILKITDLRDNWEDFYVEQVFSDLEVLVPPKESGGFDIYLFSSLTPEKYGEIFSSICDDFDYKPKIRKQSQWQSQLQ